MGREVPSKLVEAVPPFAARGMPLRIGLFQAIGLVGLALILVGGLANIVFPQLDPGFVAPGVGLPLFLIGGVVLWVGILGAWVQGIARATRVWDAVRKESAAPPK